MELKTRTEGAYAIIVLDGEIDFHFSPRVREEILRSLDDGQSVLLDLSAVSYIDSSAIASLVEGLQHAKSKGLQFGLVGVKDAVTQVLKLTRLDTVFPLHDTVEAGLATEG
jgi:anti-sigma B factor antagonist